MSAGRLEHFAQTELIVNARLSSFFFRHCCFPCTSMVTLVRSPTYPTQPQQIQVSDVPPLPDRVAAVLAPHLRASPPPPPPLLTAAAAAVNASQTSVRRSNGVKCSTVGVAGDRGENANQVGVQTTVNGSTPLRKEEILAALRAVGVGVKAPTGKRKGGKGGANSRKKDPLAAGLLAAIEV